MGIKRVGAVALTVVGMLAAAACGGSSSGSTDEEGSLSLVGFSILEAANEPVLAGFQGTDEGEGATFTTSYGSSGDQSRAVEGGLDADIVHFSLEPDMQRLVDSGQVAEDWNTGPTKGILTQSVVVMVVREGNPEGIEGWEDLAQPGLEIITPNPASSGSAKWNILAAYGSVISQGGSETEAEDYLTSLFENVVSLPSSARDATTAFQSGTGDVLLSYENEAILARQSGAEVDYVLPSETILIENPGAVTKDADPKAEAFVEYLVGEEAQTEYQKFGFRPLVEGIDVEVEGANDPADPFPAPETLLTITDDFGGWGTADTKFFDEENGIVSQIQAETGKE